eukprot:3061944-Rhodomonas_salina.1
MSAEGLPRVVRLDAVQVLHILYYHTPSRYYMGAGQGFAHRMLPCVVPVLHELTKEAGPGAGTAWEEAAA